MIEALGRLAAEGVGYADRARPGDEDEEDVRDSVRRLPGPRSRQNKLPWDLTGCFSPRCS